MKNFAGIPLLTILLLSACATPVPPAIKNPPPGNPSLREVREGVEAYLGESVRWGGTIISVENEQDRTEVQILQRKLEDDGEPIETSASQGRFLMRTSHFLDPAIYSKDREITVVGTVEGKAQRMVGNYPLTMPVVDADHYYLWPEYTDRRYYSYPYYPHPYYDFYYPYGFYRGFWW